VIIRPSIKYNKHFQLLGLEVGCLLEILWIFLNSIPNETSMGTVDDGGDHRDIRGAKVKVDYFYNFKILCCPNLS
jgi:hypothetical protein